MPDKRTSGQLAEVMLTALYRSVLVSMLAERSVLAQRANRCRIILSCSHSSPPCPPQVPGVPGHGGPGSGGAGDGALAADGHGAAGGGPLQGVGHGRRGAQHRLHIQVQTDLWWGKHFWGSYLCFMFYISQYLTQNVYCVPSWLGMNVAIHSPPQREYNM